LGRLFVFLLRSELILFERPLPLHSFCLPLLLGINLAVYLLVGFLLAPGNILFGILAHWVALTIGFVSRLVLHGPPFSFRLLYPQPDRRLTHLAYMLCTRRSCFS
jgi:hypothetical protein